MPTVAEPVVQTKEGRLRGHGTEHGYRFLGIPYAAPPDEAGWFAAPVRHAPWDGVREAASYGATAPQPDRGVTIIPEPLVPGDNCLNLNVFTPEFGRARLPVLVWIHGGGFFGGCNASPWYVGTSFARDGIVLVSVNYRLGAEGFLLIGDAPANRGVLDWVTALEWVQDNIEAFGGDPSRVTIAGQSAGGAACATLLAVPRARGLFRGAVCMSGSVGMELSLESAAEVARLTAAELGVEEDRDAFEHVPSGTLVAAQQVVMERRRPSGETLEAMIGRPGLAYAPVVDGEVVTERPLEVASSARAKEVTVMASTTVHEFNMALTTADWVTEEALRSALVGNGAPVALVNEYLRRHGAEPPQVIAGQVMTDRTFRVPAQQLLGAVADAGGTSYGYEFRWAPSEGRFAGISVHCLDIPFAFGVLGAEGVRQVAGDSPPKALADVLHGAFVSFVRELTPGWPAFDGLQCPMRILGPDAVQTEEGPLALEVGMWAGK